MDVGGGRLGGIVSAWEGAKHSVDYVTGNRDGWNQEDLIMNCIITNRRRNCHVEFCMSLYKWMDYNVIHQARKSPITKALLRWFGWGYPCAHTLVEKLYISPPRWGIWDKDIKLPGLVSWKLFFTIKKKSSVSKNRNRVGVHRWRVRRRYKCR